jgi:hypothetical protein
MPIASFDFRTRNFAIRNPLCRALGGWGSWLPLLVLATGCHRGPEVAPVSGRVMLDGKPLEAAQVRFEPKGGRASNGHTDAKGHYELRYSRDTEGALVGPHIVRIFSATEVALPNGQFAIRPQSVPPRYNSQSELQRDVQSRTNNVFDFELSTKQQPKS